METDDDLLDYNSRSSSGSASGSGVTANRVAPTASGAAERSASTRSPSSSSSSRDSSSTRSPSSSSSTRSPSSSSPRDSSPSSPSSSGSSPSSGPSSSSSSGSSGDWSDAPTRQPKVEAGEAIVDTTVYQDTIVYHDVYETEVHDSVEVKQATHTTSVTANVTKTENIQDSSVNYKMGTATEDGIAEVTLITPPVDLKRLAAQSFAEGTMSIVTAPKGFLFGNIRGRVANSFKRKREAAFSKTIFIKTKIRDEEIGIDEVTFGDIDDKGHCDMTLSFVMSRDKSTGEDVVNKILKSPMGTSIEIILSVKTGVFGSKDVMVVRVDYADLKNFRVGWGSGGKEGETSINIKNMNQRLMTDIRGDTYAERDRYVCDFVYDVKSRYISYENLMDSTMAAPPSVKSGSMNGVL